MPNHSEEEKARIREITKRYTPDNLAQKAARRDCPYGSLHHHQASYGQKNFANIGLIFEYCQARTVCKYDSTLMTLQMTCDQRADLLSELETLDPPPYHDPTNAAICRSVRDRILHTHNVAASSVYDLPATPSRDRLSHLGLQSLARSGARLESGDASTPSTTSSPACGTSASQPGVARHTNPQTPGGATSVSKGPGRPRRDEFEVTVYGYLRNGEQVTTAKAVGHLTRREQVEFKFNQDAIAQAFNFDLRSTTRPKFELYLTLGDQWTDRIMPMVLVRGQPILVRRAGVRDMPSFEFLKRVLNPPFDPNGVRPLSTFADYVFGFPSGPARISSADNRSASRTVPDNAATTLSKIFGGPPSGSAAVSSGPSTKRKHSETLTSSRKSLKSQAGARARTPDDVIYITDSEETTLARHGKGKGKARATAAARARAADDVIYLTDGQETTLGKGKVLAATKDNAHEDRKGKARATSDEIIDLTLE